MTDVSSIQSLDKERAKDFLPSSKNNHYSYGLQEHRHQDISRLLHHNYMASYAESAKEK